LDPTHAASAAAGAWARRTDAWWAAWLVLGAFALRVHWNLVAHPIGEFMYSDMKGYNNRSTAVVLSPFSTKEYDAFFPFGTTWFLAGVKAVFGVDNTIAIGVAMALVGALIVLIV
jgi:hypothetical protein